MKTIKVRGQFYAIFRAQKNGDRGTRTPDLYVANVSRYQLCYIPEIAPHTRRSFVLVGTNGLEPSTFCMSSKRSDQLSYAPEVFIL